MNHPRNNYWSMLKGIAILAVVMIHIPPTADTNSLIATRQIINFPVAMFIFLSGYFSKQGDNTWGSVKRLLFPYLIWSSFWCIITPPLSVNSLVIKYLTGGFSILYFLFVLIQLKILTPFLFRHLTKKDYKPFKDPLWLITPIYLLIFTIIRLTAVNWYQGVNSIVAFDCFFPSWLLYYYLGLYFKHFKHYNHKNKPFYIVLSLLISLSLSILAAFWLFKNSEIPNFPYTQSKLTSMLYAFCVIILFFSIRDDNMRRNFIARIGEKSFGIYLLHIPIMLLLQKIIEILPLPVGLHALFSIPVTMLVLVICLTTLVLNVLYRIIPLRILKFRK